ncbi:M24 family metallopeptidase [Clostridium bovifaecis]|uniref:M24 family metallopeptidase n=1 Tax=Clostridium bovifaecis TaxID=2184719 RepID=A0A6I6F188_9CLOT|nr:M24 family metallopeptidase [Clostridium bovifaecis]
MKTRYEKRLESLQKHLQEENVDIALFVDRENLIYYTGLTNIECMALIVPAKGGAISITLWIDVAYAKAKSAISNVVGYMFPSSNLGEKIVEMLNKTEIKSPRIGFSKYFVEFSVFDALRKGVAGIEFVNITDICYKVRSIKDEVEVQYIKKASEFLVEGMKAAIESIKPGMTEVQVLAEAEYAMRKAGSEGASFRMQVLTQDRQLIVHPYAGSNVIDNNQAIVIHLGATYNGYTSKMCRTVALGDINPETEAIYNLLIKAQDKSISMCKPPIDVKDIYNETYKIIEEAGYGKYFLDVIGYGVGIRQSEFYPIIGRSYNHTLEAGMVVDLLLPTILKKGAGGPRITDVVHIRENDVEILTKFQREMIKK